MRRLPLLLLLGFALLAPAAEARADVARPAALTLREEPGGVFRVRWQTPVRGGATLRLTPRFPGEAVRIDGSYNRALLGDALLETWRFSLPGGLEGRDVGVAGSALLRRGLVVIVRVTLASGADHRAILSGERAAFTVPEAAVAARAERWAPVSNAAAAGWALGLTWIHLLFALLVVTAGGSRALGVALGGFFGADLVGRLLPGPLPGQGLGLALVGLAAVLLARESLRLEPRRLASLTALAGLGHGLTVPRFDGFGETAAHALGVDAAHGIAGLLFLLATLVVPTPRLRRWVALPGGVVACSLAIVAALGAPAVAERTAVAPVSPMALMTDEREAPVPAPSGTPRPAVAGIELYLDIGVFQTRVEILARVPALARWLGVDPGGAGMDAEAQPAFLEHVVEAARTHLTFTVDGAAVALGSVRAGFTTQDAVGVYLREKPQHESAVDGVIGLLLDHPTPGIPASVRVEARGLPKGIALRARCLDPEVTREVVFAADTPFVAWTNTLRDDPLPPVTSLTVQPAPARIPLLGLLVCLAVWIGAWRLHTLGTGPRLALLRAGLFLLAWLATTGTVEALTLSDPVPRPTVRQQRAITATLLDNIYRAFNERGEDEVYDRLALSLTGDQLERAYVENRRILDAQRFGGARAHVDIVDLRGFDALAAGEDGSFRAAVSWTVAGSVTHFGHRHLRRNRYEAVCLIGPEGGSWKIRDFDHRSTEREP